MRAIRLLLAGLSLLAVAARDAAAAPRYKVLKHIPLELRTQPPTFVCLDHLALLDRGRLAFIGRPIEDRATFTVLDLETLETRNLTVPDTPRIQVAPKGLMVVDKPLYYDTGNGTAGILLRGGGMVSGDAALLEWDLRSNKAVRQVPLANVGNSQYFSVEMIGYDPGRRECFVEIMRPLGAAPGPTGQGGRYELSVLGVTDTVRTIATIRTTNRYTGKSPYFDPVHRRSAHVEYVEIGGEQARTGVHIVDLDSGRVHTIELPRVIYGFAFDPDGRTGYAYSNTTGEVLRFDLETGTVDNKAKRGRFGHVLDFVAPGRLLLMRNARLHLLDSKTLKELGGVDPRDFHKGSTHTEGSIVMPGRALVRVFYDLYVVDFPEYIPR